MAALALSVYVGLGAGYHRQSLACFESRHANDGDQGALTGVAATVVDVALWPIFLGFTPSDLSCEPLPVGG
jgi:hypothetical protein